MGSLLGTLLGSMGGSPDIGSSGSAGGTGDLVGALLGGMGGGAGGGMGQAGFLAPLADSIAAKAGIPRGLALVGLTFLLTKLTSSQQSAGAGGRSLSLEDLNASPGDMTAEFAAEAGIDEQTAEKTLNALMLALSSGGQ